MGQVEEASGSRLAGQAELMDQLNDFLQGAEKYRAKSELQVNQRLCSLALNLLKQLPAARDAVFEYYAGLFDRILYNYNPQSESKYDNSSAEEIAVSDLQEVLFEFVESNPRSWAPIVSKWSLDTLGKLSYCYGAKMVGKGKRGKGGDKTKDHLRNGSGSGTLHEKVTCWLGCLASRFLIEISAECLSKQISENTEGCISALLETSVVHAPHFDWVVAHLGSCFPATLINRVLTLGIKDFASAARDQNGSVAINKVPKLVSVVSILSHLGRNHHSVLQESLHSLLISSLSDTATSFDQQNTVPYILNMANISPPICQALLRGLVHLITPQLIGRIATLLPIWCKLYFPKQNSILELITNILISSERGVSELLLMIMEKGGDPESDERLAQSCRLLLNFFLSSVFTIVHGAGRHRGDSVPMFLNLNISPFLDLLVSQNQFLSSSSIQLLSLYALHKGRGVSVQILKFLLFRCETETQLGVLASILLRLEVFHCNIIPDLVSQALGNRGSAGIGHSLRLVRNLQRLAGLEEAGQQVYKSSFTACLRRSQAALVECLLQPQLAPHVLNILTVVGLSRRVRVKALHRMCHCAVEFYFNTLTSHNQDQKEKERLLHLSETLLRQLCSQRTGLQIVLRFVLEASTNSAYAVQLGGKQLENPANSGGGGGSGSGASSSASSHRTETAKLFRENFKFGSMPVQPIGSSTVFHAGVIGDGKRPEIVWPTVSDEQALLNREAVCGLLIRLCRYPSGPEEGSKKLALILVELLSPDIMYNGIPWPEEDFIKVTIERDLFISRMLSQHPVLWSLLELLALQAPALCYASVIVRAVMSVCITHWQSTVSSRLVDHPSQLQLTRKVVTLMGSGQFIPRQLAVLSQILHILDPAQLHCILIDIWNYMRVNVPGPNIFQVCEATRLLFRDFGPYEDYKPYCDRMRMVMVANLEKVSQIFKEYYVDSIKIGHSDNGAVVVVGLATGPQLNGNHLNEEPQQPRPC